MYLVRFPCGPYEKPSPFSAHSLKSLPLLMLRFTPHDCRIYLLFDIHAYPPVVSALAVFRKTLELGIPTFCAKLGNSYVISRQAGCKYCRLDYALCRYYKSSVFRTGSSASAIRRKPRSVGCEPSTVHSKKSSLPSDPEPSKK